MGRGSAHNLSGFNINEVRQEINKFLRTAYPTPSHRTAGTPTAAGGPSRGAWYPGAGPALADKGRRGARPEPRPRKAH